MHNIYSLFLYFQNCGETECKKSADKTTHLSHPHVNLPRRRWHSQPEQGARCKVMTANDECARRFVVIICESLGGSEISHVLTRQTEDKSPPLRFGEERKALLLWVKDCDGFSGLISGCQISSMTADNRGDLHVWFRVCWISNLFDSRVGRMI